MLASCGSWDDSAPTGDALVLRPFSHAELLSVDDLRREAATLFVLTRPDDALELQEAPGDEVFLWIYSSLLDLVESCGGGQPYVRAEATQVAEFADGHQKSVLAAVDMWHPDGARYPEPNVRDIEPLPMLEPPAPADLSVLWIPSRNGEPGSREVVVELHAADGTGPLLPVFTSVDLLRENCGHHQAASAFRADRIEQVAKQAGADGVVIDPVLAEGARHPAPEPTSAVPDRFGWEDDDDD